MKNHIVLTAVLILSSFFLIAWRTVEFTVAWDPNTEADMSHYNLYFVYRGVYEEILMMNPLYIPPRSTPLR